jgi:hypothetical protein
MFSYQGWKFDTIESIPYPEENFEIIKVTNLRNRESISYGSVIEEPAFMMPANAHLWHFVQEGLAQYEVIANKIPSVKLFLHDIHIGTVTEKFLSIENYCKIKGKNFKYIKDLSNIYSHDKKVYITHSRTILIKEAYFINDTLRLIDRDLVLQGNVVPYWVEATDADGNWIEGEEYKKASPYFNQDCIYDRWQMDGLHLVKDRLSPYIKENNESYKKIYISREDVNKMWSQLSPDRAFAEEHILVDYFISQGYNKVVLTNYDYIDQINIIFNATHIVGLTGSGLFNTFLCKPGTTVIEINVSGGYYWSYEYFKEFNIKVKTAELRWRKDYTAVLSKKNMDKLKELVENND